MNTYTKINLVTLVLTVLAACLLKIAGALNNDPSFTWSMAILYIPVIIACRYIALDLAK